MNKTLILFSMLIIFISFIFYINTPQVVEDETHDVKDESFTFRRVGDTSICKDLNMRVYNNTHCYTNAPSSS